MSMKKKNLIDNDVKRITSIIDNMVLQYVDKNSSANPEKVRTVATSILNEFLSIPCTPWMD